MARNQLTKVVQNEAYQLVIWQLAGVFLLAFLALLWRGSMSSLAVLAGGMAYGLPNLFFVWGVFRFVGAQQMNAFVIAFFFGEMLKLALSAFFVLIIVKHLPDSLSSTLVGFIGAIVSFWIVCMLHFSRRAVPKQTISR